MNEWTETDAALFREFLDKPAGKKLMESHGSSRPKITSTTYERAAGWEDSHAWLVAQATFTKTPTKAPDMIDVATD